MTHKDGVMPIPRPAKRERAPRRTLKAVSEKRAASGEPKGLKRTELSRTSERRREEKPNATSTLKRSGPLGHASEEQKAKVQREGARVDESVIAIATRYEVSGLGPIDPAHIVSRAMGGCDHEDCIVPLPRFIHRLFDEGKFDLLPWLTREEQAHAVSHLGILGALKRTTGETYEPQPEGAMP